MRKNKTSFPKEGPGRLLIGEPFVKKLWIT